MDEGFLLHPTLSTYLSWVFFFDVILYAKLGTKTSDARHIKCSRRFPTSALSFTHTFIYRTISVFIRFFVFFAAVTLKTARAVIRCGNATDVCLMLKFQVRRRWKYKRETQLLTPCLDPV